jgi:ankyrin repeat protein
MKIHVDFSPVGDNDMDTPLHMCESIECANLLLQRGAELNARNAEGRTVREWYMYNRTRVSS